MVSIVIGLMELHKKNVNHGNIKGSMSAGGKRREFGGGVRFARREATTRYVSM
jgi:hypothetical protein